jgi:hypothetical protein
MIDRDKVLLMTGEDRMAEIRAIIQARVNRTFSVNGVQPSPEECQFTDDEILTMETLASVNRDQPPPPPVAEEEIGDGE